MIPDIKAILKRQMMTDEEYLFLTVESYMQKRCFYCGRTYHLVGTNKALVCSACYNIVFINKTRKPLQVLREWWK